MDLRFSQSFAAAGDVDAFLASLPSQSAVFAVFPIARDGVPSSPYLGRTGNLHRRLARLLSPRQSSSKMLNLRELAARVDYEPVGSAFESTWLLFQLNRHYYARQFRERMRLKPPALLKIRMANRFPRCYSTRRMVNDGSLYYGPFPSGAAAERFAGEFLDFFKIRRCVEGNLNPDPSHPGCIYSQLRMCLAPCFAGCTDSAYQDEVHRVVQFLDSQGQSLLRSLQSERDHASESLEFEQASKVHQKIEKLNDVLRQKFDLVKNLRELQAIMVLPGAEAKSVVFFRVRSGEVCGPATLSLDENSANPIPLDRQIHEMMESLPGESGRTNPASLPPWEHLSLLARWYYSSFREGEWVMLNADQAIPHSRLIRICRKVLAQKEAGDSQ